MKIVIERKKRSEKPFVQFSKRCLSAMILLWFLGALFGFAVVTAQTVRGDVIISIGDVLVYIGAPMTGGIVSYMIKSAWEKKKNTEGESVCI